LWDAFLPTLVGDLPSLFAGRWPVIFDRIFAEGASCDLVPSFATSLGDNELKEILRALLARRPFPLEFAIDFLVANMNRFDLVWGSFLESYEPEIGSNREVDKAALGLWLGLMEMSFADITESAFLQFGAYLLAKSSNLLPPEKLSILQAVRAAITTCSLSTTWPVILQILDPDNFSEDPHLMIEAFSLTNLYPSSDSSVKDFINIILKFAANPTAINVSLSSFDLLWQIKVSLDAETWTVLLNRVAALFMDERFDVAHAAIKTFFSFLSSKADEIPNSVTSYYLTIVWPEILKNQVMFQRQRVFVVLLQEMAHYICSFWDESDSNALRLQFVPLLLEASERFLMDCTSKDIAIESYQIYGYFLTAAAAPMEVQVAWMESVRRLLFNKFKLIRDWNSSILSQMGGLMGNVIASFAGRFEKAPYREWVKLVADMALSFESNEFVHIMTLRTLDGFVCLFPMPDLQETITLGMFVDLFTQTDHPSLKKTVCNIFMNIWKEATVRPKLLLVSRPIIPSDIALRLCETFVSCQTVFDESQRKGALECYQEIARCHPSLSAEANKCAQSIAT
jgi:hypothetical protein